MPKIVDVFLDPVVDANPRALEAIEKADAIVFGPGDLYTSIVPNLLARNVAEAVSSSNARKIYVCNLMTKLGETEGFATSDFAGEIVRYLDGSKLDSVLVNSRPVPSDTLVRYAGEGAVPVDHDEITLSQHTQSVMAVPLSINHPKVRHDPERLAEAVLSAMMMNGNCEPSSWDEFEELPDPDSEIRIQAVVAD